MKAVRSIGNQFINERAGKGAAFLVVGYDITNEGNETSTGLADDFEILDTQGRKFRSSSRGNTAFAMSGGDKDLILAELQPGITKEMTQVFEVPEASLDGAALRVPEKGLFGSKSVLVTLATREPAAQPKKK